METLSEQLYELYYRKWRGLMAQLEANGLRDKLQCPFLLSVYRTGVKAKEMERLQENGAVYNQWYAENMISSNEDWYAKADIKIMFFGKEPNGWTRDEENNRTDISTIMDEYGFFLDDRYEVRANGGYFNQGSSFFKVGVNKMMEGMEMILKDYPNKRVSMMWNEISKLSTRKKKGGGPVNSFTHEIERKYFHVIRCFSDSNAAFGRTSASVGNVTYYRAFSLSGGSHFTFPGDRGHGLVGTVPIQPGIVGISRSYIRTDDCLFSDI